MEVRLKLFPATPGLDASSKEDVAVQCRCSMLTLIQLNVCLRYATFSFSFLTVLSLLMQYMGFLNWPLCARSDVVLSVNFLQLGLIALFYNRVHSRSVLQLFTC